MAAIASFDTAQIFVDLMDDNWNATNVVKPTIGLVENYKRIDVRSGDFILVYDSGSLTRERGDLEWYSEDISGTVRVDIRSSTRARLNDLYDEVQRIMYLKRKEPATGWHKIENSNRVNLTNKAIKLYRYVVDYRIMARKKQIVT